MTPDVRSRAPALTLPSVRSVITAPLRLQSYKNFVYLWVAFTLGTLYFVTFTVMFAFSVALLVALIGVPLLVVSCLSTLAVGRFEIALTAWMLDVEIPVPSYGYLFEGSPVDRGRALVTDRTLWTTLVYLVTKFLFGIFAFFVLAVPSLISASLLTTPLYYDQSALTVGLQLTDPIRLTPSVSLAWNELAVGVETALRVTSWQVETLPEALAVSLVGLVASVFVVNLSNALARGWAWYSQYMLGATDRDSSGA